MKPTFCVKAMFKEQVKTLNCDSYLDAIDLADMLNTANRRAEIVLAVPVSNGTIFIPYVQFATVHKAIEEAWSSSTQPVSQAKAAVR